MNYSKQNALNILKTYKKGNLSKANREAQNMFLRHYGYTWQQVGNVAQAEWLRSERWALIKDGVEYQIEDALKAIANS